MVGALEDWFAVIALFHRVPQPVIPLSFRNKVKIADNLALFIQDEFLSNTFK